MGLLRQRRARIPFSPQWVNALGPRSDGKRFVRFTEIGDNQFRWQVAEWDQWTRAGLVPGKHGHSTQVFVHDQRHPMITDMTWLCPGETCTTWTRCLPKSTNHWISAHGKVWVFHRNLAVFGHASLTRSCPKPQPWQHLFCSPGSWPHQLLVGGHSLSSPQKIYQM